MNLNITCTPALQTCTSCLSPSYNMIIYPYNHQFHGLKPCKLVNFPVFMTPEPQYYFHSCTPRLALPVPSLDNRVWCRLYSEELRTSFGGSMHCVGCQVQTLDKWDVLLENLTPKLAHYVLLEAYKVWNMNRCFVL